MLPRSPSSFTPLPDGRYLHDGTGQGNDSRARFQSSQRETPRTCRSSKPCSNASPASSNPCWSRRRPTRGRLAPGNLMRLAKTAWNFRKLGVDGQKAIEILTGAANPILDRWFESEEVKTTHLDRRHHRRVRHAVHARHGLRALPSRHGRVRRRARRLGLRPRRHGRAFQRHRRLRPKNAVRKSRVNAPVSRILVKDGRARGVVLADGTEYQRRQSRLVP